MGYYLNPVDIIDIYKRETVKPYFVDKTEMLKELIPLVEQQGSCLSVTRPRRFGKSVMAAMIGSFFGKGVDSTEMFSHLKIGREKDYAKHLNQHNLIYIDFSRDVSECSSYKEYITIIKKRLIRDLKKAYPNADIFEEDSIGAILRTISLEYNNEKFLMIFDEWDYVFHKNYFAEADRGKFTAFLGDMTKGRAYVEMAYLTGVLPIKKYSASDTMNHFDEYNMANSDVYDEYFGFTDEEVDELYLRYLENHDKAEFSRDDLAEWYDGYQRENGDSIYNPNSVVRALTRNTLKNYWAKAGEYDELKDYVLDDVDGMREAVMLLAAGEPVEADLSEYASTATELKYRDEILSVMTVYGYLNYSNGRVRIPNKELEMEFDRIMRTESKYSYMRELEKESARILQATYDGDEDTVGKILAIVHTTESPLKAYNDEAELSGSVKLAYIAARNKYDMQREDQAGIGYVDYIFYPHNRSDDGIIIELKVDDSPETALKQIKDKNYALKFQGKLGEQPKTTGRIILVGIGYCRKDKVHRCKIEILYNI
ncbi:MAG: ATP-binding protein [Lachnospiraceae bacterium]|nr:ATP-binding protein [Lachnospiraceae bacterium]MCD7832560.1 ATP-binding protein [Lachnospiraceae bacterium]